MSATICDPNDISFVSFVVVADDKQRCRIWPSFTTAPRGWRVVYGEATCAACLDYIIDQQASSLARMPASR